MSKSKLKSSPSFDRLFASLQIDEVLQRTEDYKDYISLNSNKYTTKVIYRIKSLLCYGRFDEAEILCYEALNCPSLLTKGKYMINVYLYQIYFYKRELWKSFYYYKNIPTEDDKYSSIINRDFVLKFIEDGNPELFKKITNIPKECIIGHVQSKRAGNLNFGEDAVIDAIMQEFNKATVYYDNVMQIRIFSCFNVGKSEYNGKNETCDYLYVCSINDNPCSIKTFYPISSPGSLKCHDISGLVRSLDSKNQSTGNAASELTSGSATQKFMARQRKMNTKIENK